MLRYFSRPRKHLMTDPRNVMPFLYKKDEIVINYIIINYCYAIYFFEEQSIIYVGLT